MWVCVLERFHSAWHWPSFHGQLQVTRESRVRGMPLFKIKSIIGRSPKFYSKKLIIHNIFFTLVFVQKGVLICQYIWQEHVGLYYWFLMFICYFPCEPFPCFYLLQNSTSPILFCHHSIHTRNPPKFVILTRWWMTQVVKLHPGSRLIDKVWNRELQHFWMNCA